MPSVFLVSDTHFGHWGVCKFATHDGNDKLRPWDTPDEMDEAMVKLWNDCVKPTDKVYHLGDVVINRRALSIMHRLNGDKVLIKGNHDIFRAEEYLEHFRDIRAYHVMNNFLLAHIPVHPDSVSRWDGQFHGHTHDFILPDKRYHNVCVENTGFKPILFEEALKLAKERNAE